MAHIPTHDKSNVDVRCVMNVSRDTFVYGITTENSDYLLNL